MRYLWMSRKTVALSLLFALALTMLPAMVAASRASIEPGVSAQDFKEGKTTGALDGFWWLIKQAFEILRSLMTAEECIATSPPSEWHRCFDKW